MSSKKQSASGDGRSLGEGTARESCAGDARGESTAIASSARLSSRSNILQRFNSLIILRRRGDTSSPVSTTDATASAAAAAAAALESNLGASSGSASSADAGADGNAERGPELDAHADATEAELDAACEQAVDEEDAAPPRPTSCWQSSACLVTLERCKIRLRAAEPARCR